jgi:hypothetical protein
MSNSNKVSIYERSKMERAYLSDKKCWRVGYLVYAGPRTRYSSGHYIIVDQGPMTYEEAKKIADAFVVPKANHPQGCSWKAEPLLIRKVSIVYLREARSKGILPNP